MPSTLIVILAFTKATPSLPLKKNNQSQHRSLTTFFRNLTDIRECGHQTSTPLTMNCFSNIFNIRLNQFYEEVYQASHFNVSSIPSEIFSKRMSRHLIITVWRPLFRKFLKKGPPTFSNIKWTRSEALKTRPVILPCTDDVHSFQILSS
jgi:hypothetical protein